VSRLKIVHVTGLRYAEGVTASYNEARMLPRTREGQFVLSAGLDISPIGAQMAYTDYWGAHVVAFEVLTPHDELRVTATSVVDVRPVPQQPLHYTWDALAAAFPTSLELTDYVAQTPTTEPDDSMRELAQEIRSRGGDVNETAYEICRAVGLAMEYRRGVTGVNSTARDAWPKRSGVCQDIAHVALGLLRDAGIPARYVSGYLHPSREARIGDSVTGESHAWVEWFAGQWHGFDPTNLTEIGDLHVYVGHGRDYNDVAPLRGVYAGTGGSELFVSVRLTRLA
jgi:transglutaminase-like putative cysteine protease